MSIEIAILIILITIWVTLLVMQAMCNNMIRLLGHILEKTTYNQQIIDSNEKALNLLLVEYTKNNIKEK